jgi:DHA2 family multidrug resistance protein
MPMNTTATNPRPVNPWLVALTVSMATFMEVLDVSIANVSLGHIAGNLGAGQSESTWVLSSYLVANAIILPISGWLSSVVGRKRFYMASVALFTIASALCGMAPSMGMLLVFRVIQGLGGGGLAPSEQAILANTFSPKELGKAFAIYGVAVVVAPAIGPVIGGWLTDNYSWRWIFFINIPVGLLSLFLTSRVVHDSEEAKREHEQVWKGGLKVDYMGFGLVALGLGALQIVLDKGQEDDWLDSRFIQIFAALAVVGLVGMLLWELFGTKDPIVDIPLLKSRTLLSSMGLMFALGFIINATTVLIPQFLQDMMGYNATKAGLVLLPGGVALMLGFVIAGALSNKVQPKILMAAGLGATALALFHMTGFTASMDFGHVASARIYQSILMPLIFVPVNTVAYMNLPKGKNNNASALLNMMRNLGGSVGISLAVALLERRAQVHVSRLLDHTSAYDPAFAEQLRTQGSDQGTLARLYQGVLTQAQLLSYIDVFKFSAVLCVIVVAVVLALPRVKLGDKSAPVGH